MSVYPFIEAEKQGRRNVKRACELLKVSRTAYYAARDGQPSDRDRQDAGLIIRIAAGHKRSKGRYGAPRIHAELRGQGRRHSRKRVARLMRRAGLAGRAPKRWKKTTIPDPAAAARADAIRRDFTADASKINQRWCGDITYIATWEGWLYLATVIDIASRRVVGFALAGHLRTELVADAQSWDWAQLAKRQLERRPLELLQSILQLIDAGAMQIFGPGEERELLEGALRSSGAPGWDLVMSMLEAGSWRIQMDGRGWLTSLFPAELVTEWIGTDKERAKLVASIAQTGDDEPDPMARYLLEHFEDEKRVASSLAGTFFSGFWWGSESDRLATQIAQLRRWIEAPSEPEGVKRWAREMIQSLERQRSDALQREAEEDFS